MARLSFRRATDATQKDPKLSFRTQMLLAAGYNKDEVAGMELSNLPDEEFQKTVRENLLGAMVNNGSKQKVIQMREVEQYIQRGWEYAAPLSNEKAILKLPT